GQLAPFSSESYTALNAALPPFWSHANPIDILGDATPDRYRLCLDVLAKDPNVQGILLLLTPQAMTDPTETARQVSPFARSTNKPPPRGWGGGPPGRGGKAPPGRARHPHLRPAGGRHRPFFKHGPVPPQPGAALRAPAGPGRGLPPRRRQ